MARVRDVNGYYTCDRECGDTIDDYRYPDEMLTDPDETILCERCIADEIFERTHDTNGERLR